MTSPSFFLRSLESFLCHIEKQPQALTRLIAYMHARGLDWEDRFGTLVEIDLFAFLMEVHVEAIANGTTSRPGFSAVWGSFSGIHYLSPHFNLPTEEVRSSLPHKGVQHGVESILEGSLPLPPAALQRVCDYAADPRTPPVMVSSAHALAFTALSSLRQANAQQLCNYDILTFGERDYLVSQHTDGKSRTNLPTVFLTPFKICEDVGAGSTAGALYCGTTVISSGLTQTEIRCYLPLGFCAAHYPTGKS